MTRTAPRWDGPPPEGLASPTLIVMLTGWIDAGGAAAAAMTAIQDESDARVVAVFDDDTYVDYRARRPTMTLREGHVDAFDWQRITVAVGRDRAGHDLVLLSGPEPDMAWHAFADEVGELAVQLGVGRAVSLGAYPFTAPHTRPSRISVTSTSEDVLTSVPFLRSSVEVPAGVAAVIELALHERDIPSMGLWAQVPHYVASTPYPAASVALLDALRPAADVIVDAADLRRTVAAHRARLDEMVADQPDHLRLVEQLERLHDASSDRWDGATGSVPGGTGAPGLEFRSGDELAQELEAFLRDQDD